MTTRVALLRAIAFTALVVGSGFSEDATAADLVSPVRLRHIVERGVRASWPEERPDAPLS